MATTGDQAVAGRHPGWNSLAWSTALLLASLVALPPFWETNDDVAMSMMAHGYGIAAYPSPFLLFTNVAWGKVLTSLPTLAGVVPYSWASLVSLLATAWAILYFLMRAGVRHPIAVAAIALVFAKAVVFPQFTITAGLMAAGAIVGWCTYARIGGTAFLTVATALAFGGFLVRYDQALLVLAVAAPLLLHASLLRDRRFQASIAILVVAAAGAAALDAWAYSAPEWRSHAALSFYIRAFSDYGVLNHIAAHPEIATKHGFSLNDLTLFMRFFYVDPAIADPARLGALMGELDLRSVVQSNVPKGWAAIRSLARPEVAPLTVAAVAAALLLHRGWRLLAAWALFLLAIFAIGLLGRAGQIRVYYPLVALLFVIPLMYAPPRGARLAAAGAVTAAMLAWMIFTLVPAHEALEKRHAAAREDLLQLARGELHVDWGGQFPYEAAHPVLLREQAVREIRLYTLASSSVAPFSLAQWKDEPQKGMVERLLSGPSLPLIADESRLALLREYCREHHRRPLAVERVQRLQTFTIRFVSCRAPAPEKP